MACSRPLSELAGDIEGDNTRFEKRARYKTREDKYETDRRHVAHQKGTRDDSKSKRRDYHGGHKKKKLVLTSSKDVMEKFSSMAILSERLTVSSIMRTVPTQG